MIFLLFLAGCTAFFACYFGGTEAVLVFTFMALSYGSGRADGYGVGLKALGRVLEGKRHEPKRH